MHRCKRAQLHPLLYFRKCGGEAVLARISSNKIHYLLLPFGKHGMIIPPAYRTKTEVIHREYSGGTQKLGYSSHLFLSFLRKRESRPLLVNLDSCSLLSQGQASQE